MSCRGEGGAGVFAPSTRYITARSVEHMISSMCIAHLSLDRKHVHTQYKVRVIQRFYLPPVEAVHLMSDVGKRTRLDPKLTCYVSAIIKERRTKHISHENVFIYLSCAVVCIAEEKSNSFSFFHPTQDAPMWSFP